MSWNLVMNIVENENIFWWNQNQMFHIRETRPLSQIQDLSIFPLTCGEWPNCGICWRSGLPWVLGLDPTHVITHLLGFFPGKNRVMCLVHGGKSIPWNVSFREPCGTTKRVFPFSVKRLLLQEAVGRSEVRCTQCPLSAAHKTHSWCRNSIQNPSGQRWKLLAPQFFLHSACQNTNACLFETVTGKVINNVWILHIPLDKKCDTSTDE